jgi:hypothetical protein
MTVWMGRVRARIRQLCSTKPLARVGQVRHLGPPRLLTARPVVRAGDRHLDHPLEQTALAAEGEVDRLRPYAGLLGDRRDGSHLLHLQNPPAMAVGLASFHARHPLTAAVRAA